jgi:hypothetical protein
LDLPRRRRLTLGRRLPFGANLRDFTLWNISLRSITLRNLSLRSRRLRTRRRLNLSLDARRGFTLGRSWLYVSLQAGRREIALRARLRRIILGTAWLLNLRDRTDT